MSALTTIRSTDAPDTLRAMLRTVMPSLEWRHHGIGVLQAYIRERCEPEIRCHIWHPDLVKEGMNVSGDVHDHRFDMVSHVIYGQVWHEEWLTVPNLNGVYETTELTHARAAADTNFHGPIRRTGDRLDVSVHTLCIPEKSTYSYPRGVFHRSPVIELAITIVEKHNQTNIPARLLHPIDVPPVMAFGHDIDRGLIGRIVTSALQAIS